MSLPLTVNQKPAINYKETENTIENLDPQSSSILSRLSQPKPEFRMAGPLPNHFHLLFAFPVNEGTGPLLNFLSAAELDSKDAVRRKGEE